MLVQAQNPTAQQINEFEIEKDFATCILQTRTAELVASACPKWLMTPQHIVREAERERERGGSDWHLQNRSVAFVISGGRGWCASRWRPASLPSAPR